MKKILLAILLLPLLFSCNKDKKALQPKSNFEENKKILDLEINRLNLSKNKSSSLQINSVNTNNFNLENYIEETYGQDGSNLFNGLTNGATNEIVIPNNLQYLDSQTPFQLNESIKSEFQQITNFDDIYQNNNVSPAMRFKLDELKSSLLQLSSQKIEDVIYNGDETAISNESVFVDNLESEVTQKINLFNNTIGETFSLTPTEQNQLLMASYLADESLNNTNINLDYLNNLNNNLQVNSLIKVNGFFKSVLNVLKTVAKIVLVVVVSVAIVAAVVATGAVLGALIGSIAITQGGIAVGYLGGEVVGALIGLYVGSKYIASEKYSNSRLIGWIAGL